MNKISLVVLGLLFVFGSALGSAKNFDRLNGLKVEFFRESSRGIHETHQFEIKDDKFFIDGVEIPQALLPLMAGEIRSLREVDPIDPPFCSEGRFQHSVSLGGETKAEVGCIGSPRFLELVENFSRLQRLPL